MDQEQQHTEQGQGNTQPQGARQQPTPAQSPNAMPIPDQQPGTNPMPGQEAYAYPPYGFAPYPQPMPYPGYPQGYPYANLSMGGPNMEQAPAFVPYSQGGAITMNGGIAPGVEVAEASTHMEEDDFDYSNIQTPARIAVYDSLQSAPRVIQVPGGPTHEFIERIASLTYQHSQQAGGSIPYSVIREVSENFIHAQFKEVVVSILDKGSTIRFTDQGPGIKDKTLVQMPGVTSATEPMKRYIRGVGSGLPLVKDALSFSNGTITIEDNINQGAVVTISMLPNPTRVAAPAPTTPTNHKLTENERAILRALASVDAAGITEVHNLTRVPVSSIHVAFGKLEEAGLVTTVGNKKRSLTAEGRSAASAL